MLAEDLCLISLCRYQEGKIQESLIKYQECTIAQGYRNETNYHMALCHYTLKEYPLATKLVDEIIEKGKQQYPGQKPVCLSSCKC